MAENISDTKPENPESLIQAAITHELMQNPYCPIPGLLSELMENYRQSGDTSTLDLALQIANESLKPRKPNFLEKIWGLISHS